MGYLNNATTVLDAVLTKKGRELLSRGEQAFNITKFALADDEVDYSLWNVAHPLGTDYYGTVIENLPLLEPTADPDTVMKYKLITRSDNPNKLPVMSSLADRTVQWQVNSAGSPETVTPNLINFGSVMGEFMFTILNSSIAYLTTATNTGVGTGGVDYTQSVDSISQTVIGSTCDIIAKSVPNNTNAGASSGQPDPTTTVVVTSIEHGATAAFTVTVDYVDNADSSAGGG
tara:strand:+ start:1482 stop:2171 length:690 start_codon:yes stop_codon:yes gene_type:complete